MTDAGRPQAWPGRRREDQVAADPNFQGIDPQQLGQLMQSLKNGVNNAQPLANSYMGQFTRLGLDTTAVTRLQQNYSWSQSQQTMLQRRYTLATHQPSGQFKDGMATAGAGALQYATAAQAQAAGAKAAQQYQDGKITAAQYFKLLEANSHDPDWQTGAAKTLGSTGVQQLEQAARDQYPANTAGLKALAAAVAAGMAAGVTYPYSSDPMDKGTENLQLLAPLLGYASFPASALVTLGNEVTRGGPNTDAVTADPVLKALAANPQAAAQFMAQFQNTHGVNLAAYVAQGSDHYGMMPPEEASLFANVITAGTVGAKTVDPKLAAQNVTSLVSYYSSNPSSHTYGPIQAAYGNIIKTYWPDVVFSITSGAPDPKGYLTSPNGLHLTATQWEGLTDEAMRDGPTAGMLLNQAHTQQGYFIDLASKQPTGNGGTLLYDGGLVSGFFDSQASKTYKSIPAPTTWQSQVSGYIGTAAGTAVNIVADPGSTVKTVVKSLATVGLTAATTAFVKDLPSNTGSSNSSPTYQTPEGTNSETLIKEYNNKKQGFPLDSVSKYGGGNFVVNGSIPPTDQMSPAQLAAFNAWMQDPEIASYLHSDAAQSGTDGYNEWFTGPEPGVGAG